MNADTFDELLSSVKQADDAMDIKRTFAIGLIEKAIEQGVISRISGIKMVDILKETLGDGNANN